MASDNQIQVEVIVNGESTTVDANANAPLQSLIGQALQQTGNQGQPPDNWELRDEEGNILDLNTTISDIDLTGDRKLFLNLKAGVGGQS